MCVCVCNVCVCVWLFSTTVLPIQGLCLSVRLKMKAEGHLSDNPDRMEIRENKREQKNKEKWEMWPLSQKRKTPGIRQHHSARRVGVIPRPAFWMLNRAPPLTRKLHYKQLWTTFIVLKDDILQPFRWMGSFHIKRSAVPGLGQWRENKGYYALSFSIVRHKQCGIKVFGSQGKCLKQFNCILNVYFNYLTLEYMQIHCSTNKKLTRLSSVH